jgi:hypothetical protein
MPADGRRVLQIYIIPFSFRSHVSLEARFLLLGCLARVVKDWCSRHKSALPLLAQYLWFEHKMTFLDSSAGITKPLIYL